MLQSRSWVKVLRSHFKCGTVYTLRRQELQHFVYGVQNSNSNPLRRLISQQSTPGAPGVLSFVQQQSVVQNFAAISRKMSTAKEKFLSMEIEEKRSCYKCGEKYVVLDKVQSWNDYTTEAGLSTDKKGSDDGPKFTPSQTLNSKVSVWRGDITTLEIDAIVNAANNSLLGGGGVDGAIHSAAGKDLLEECKALNGCETGEAKITGGYKLPTKYVIHTVGPRGEKPDKLSQCYNNALTLLLNNKLRTIAFPCISTGIYGYPSMNAAHVALKTVRQFLEKNEGEVDRVIFCIFLKEDWEIYQELMQQYFPVVPR